MTLTGSGFCFCLFITNIFDLTLPGLEKMLEMWPGSSLASDFASAEVFKNTLPAYNSGLSPESSTLADPLVGLNGDQDLFLPFSSKLLLSPNVSRVTQSMDPLPLSDLLDFEQQHPYNGTFPMAASSPTPDVNFGYSFSHLLQVPFPLSPEAPSFQFPSSRPSSFVVPFVKYHNDERTLCSSKSGTNAMAPHTASLDDNDHNNDCDTRPQGCEDCLFVLAAFTRRQCTTTSRDCVSVVISIGAPSPFPSASATTKTKDNPRVQGSPPFSDSPKHPPVLTLYDLLEASFDAFNLCAEDTPYTARPSVRHSKSVPSSSSQTSRRIWRKSKPTSWAVHVVLSSAGTSTMAPEPSHSSTILARIPMSSALLPGRAHSATPPSSPPIALYARVRIVPGTETISFIDNAFAHPDDSSSVAQSSIP
ncbi:hypothetical protein BU15DRAFT_66475 [Melanogaster broomeanus]|nr:hypothetical protein BU15DRAFT_66475 [Melanogaster broomeanus]